MVGVPVILRLYLREFFRLPMEVVVNLHTVNVNFVQLSERDIAPFSVFRVVENSKAEKEIFAIKFSNVPVAAAEGKNRH